MNRFTKSFVGLLLIISGFSLPAQITKDSLLGGFVGTYIVTQNWDTLNYIESVPLLVRNSVGECEVERYLGENFSGVFSIKTFELGFCERNKFEVNRDSLLVNGTTAPIIHFFGKDSVLQLFAFYDSEMNWNTSEFRGIRDPNFQSISPPLNKEDLKVFPNPTNNQVTIQFPEPGTLKVFNMLGQVQVQLPFSGEQQLNVENWSEGVYIVELEVKGAKIRQRVVVQ